MTVLALSDRETLHLGPGEATRRRDGVVEQSFPLPEKTSLAALASPELLVVLHQAASLVWLTTGQVLSDFAEGLPARPACLAVSEDGARLAVSGRKETCLFELPGGRRLATIAHPEPFFVDLVEAGLLLASARKNGLVLWERHVFEHPDSYPVVTFGEGRYLAALADSSRLTTWDVESGQELWSRRVSTQRDASITLAGHRQADRFVLLLPDGQIEVWGAGERPLASGRLAHERLPDEPVALAPSGQVLHYASPSGWLGEGLPELYGC